MISNSNVSHAKVAEAMAMTPSGLYQLLKKPEFPRLRLKKLLEWFGIDPEEFNPSLISRNNFHADLPFTMTKDEFDAELALQTLDLRKELSDVKSQLIAAKSEINATQAKIIALLESRN